MTDMLRYQDVFQTNIHESKNDITLQIEYLLDAVQQPEFDDLPIFRYARPVTEKHQDVFQAFWEQKDERGRVQRLLAITASKVGITIGIDRRPTDEQPTSFKQSIRNYDTVHGDYGSAEFHGSTEPEVIESFFEEFYATTASLGLSHHLKRMVDQRLSDSAIFANAA